MKTIKLIDRAPIIAKEQLATVMRMHVLDGITVGEMRICIKVLKLIEGATDALTLEDADYAALMRYWEKAKFQIAHENIVLLEDDLKAAVSS